MIKKISIAFLSIFLTIAGLVTLYAIDANKNRGFHFGYYGEYNRIVEAVEEMPEVEIVKPYAHHDVSLEEIWIELKTHDEKELTLKIGQNEKFRKLRGEKLSIELKKRIENIRSNQALQTTSASARRLS